MSRNPVRNKSLIKTRQLVADTAYFQTLNTNSDLGGGGEATTLTDLTDTNIVAENQSDGNLLEWQTDKWITSNTISNQITTIDTKINRITNPYPTKANVYAEVNSKPYRNDGSAQYDVNIYANTGDYNTILKSWKFIFIYNRDVLTYNSAIVGDGKKYYGNSLTVSDIIVNDLGPPTFPNMRELSIEQTDQFSNFDLWEGSDDRLYLATARFLVKSGVSSGLYSGFCASRDSFLYNQNGTRYGAYFGGWRVVGDPTIQDGFTTHKILITPNSGVGLV